MKNGRINVTKNGRINAGIWSWRYHPDYHFIPGCWLFFKSLSNYLWSSWSHVHVVSPPPPKITRKMSGRRGCLMYRSCKYFRKCLIMSICCCFLNWSWMGTKMRFLHDHFLKVSFFSYYYTYLDSLIYSIFISTGFIGNDISPLVFSFLFYCAESWKGFSSPISNR